MNQFVKSLLAVGITSALSISLISNVSAATYEIVDQGEVSKLKYTYAQHQNSAGDMAISGTNLYNFPVQFDYLDDDDFDAIEIYVALRHLNVNGLNDIEDSDALRAGNPTANDLAWVVRWLQDTSSGTGSDIEYQKVGDTIPMTNFGGVTTDYNIWDVTFEGTETLTRSTVDIVSGITDSGISYGTATAPYLPSEPHIDAEGVEHTFWVREHGMRGFASYDLGAQVLEIVPFETVHAGGVSAVLDVSEEGVAVGFSSYKVSKFFDDAINEATGGCADPDIVPGRMTLEACVAEVQLRSSADIYHSMALKATLDPNGNPVVEQLGLLVTPHPDDTRPYSSYALAVNSQGVVVGYADGFNDETVTDPAVGERRDYHYAVVFKNGEVIDLTGDHTDKGSSRAYDINNAGIAVGHITRAINGKGVEKFFYVDTNVSKEEVNMISPEDFFSGSDSTARAINNSGLIVGEGEIETHNESSSNPRRTAAFVYDMNDDIFANLNELIPCNLRQTYNIIEARGINDAGVISATAVVKTDRRDAKGEIMLDSSGSPLKEDVVRAISLNPIPDDGEVCTAEEEGKVERQGASLGFGSTWLLLAILGLRRKFFSFYLN
ncbi:MAG: DUF3466 family protein [Colwellia sp.]|nr:DUF3466 family protein [Colwellia sp.]MCW9082987.1 DUF3466 family protein [Colwellia sp.]